MQYGGGSCSICGAPGTNKTTCPKNPANVNKDKSKLHKLGSKSPEYKTPENERSEFDVNIRAEERIEPKKSTPEKSPKKSPKKSTSPKKTSSPELDINAQDKDGSTLLHRYVKYPEVVKKLLDAGANVNIPDKLGNTPLLRLFSSTRSSYDSAYILLQYGADVNQENYHDVNALEYLINSYDDRELEKNAADIVDLVKLLVKYNIKVEGDYTIFLQNMVRKERITYKQFAQLQFYGQIFWWGK